VTEREVCAIASSAESDFDTMSCSKRRTSGDLSSARLSSVLANDIALISRGTRAWQTLTAVPARSRDCGIDLAPQKEQTGKPENKNAGTDCSVVFSKELLGLRMQT
jgi:hypothetical protein